MKKYDSSDWLSVRMSQIFKKECDKFIAIVDEAISAEAEAVYNIEAGILQDDFGEVTSIHKNKCEIVLFIQNYLTHYLFEIDLNYIRNHFQLNEERLYLEYKCFEGKQSAENLLDHQLIYSDYSLLKDAVPDLMNEIYSILIKQCRKFLEKGA